MLLALAVAGAAFAAVLLLGGSSHNGSGSGGAGPVGAAVQLHGVSGYDPEGDGVEHDELAGLATDDNPSTSWTTESYTNQDFGNLKSGVGLLLSARGPVKLAHLTVTTPTPGFTAEIKSGDSPTGSFSVDSSSEQVTGSTTFTLHGQTAQYYVVWITQLPPGLQADISEVTAKS